MSHKVTTLVYSRKAGSAVRKAILAYMADRASDDGSGVWASKQTIADDLECGRSTVIRVCNEFVSEGILIETGTRKCANGATIEYRINMAAVSALETIEKRGKPSQSGTSLDVDPSQSGTPPVPERDPKPSQSGTQTTLEPSMNQERPKGLLSSGDDVTAAFEAYNQSAQEAGWPEAKVLSKARRAALRNRLREVGGIDGWHDALAKARASPLCTGDNDRGWKADLDFLLQQKSFTRLMEGSYDARPNQSPQHSPQSSGKGGRSFLDEIAAASRN